MGVGSLLGVLAWLAQRVIQPRTGRDGVQTWEGLNVNENYSYYSAEL